MTEWLIRGAIALGFFVVGILFNVWMARQPRRDAEANQRYQVNDPVNEDALKQRGRGGERL